MVSIYRHAKCGKDWTMNDLQAYNITVSSQSPYQFYGKPLPKVKSLTSIDPNLLSGTLGTPGLSDETYRLLQYLDLASRVESSQASAVHDFTKEILRALGYEKRGLLLRSRYAIPLLVAGDANRTVQTDVCLVQGSSAVLMVVHWQEDKNTVSVDPEPQVIAEAIAAFHFNNRIRARLAETELGSMTIPCIAMIGTRPIFYLVPVTRELSDAVARASYPPSRTVVKKCVVASNSRSISEGMETPSFRQVALQHYTAFRPLAETHWSSFTVPGEMGVLADGEDARESKVRVRKDDQETKPTVTRASKRMKTCGL